MKQNGRRVAMDAPGTKAVPSIQVRSWFTEPDCNLIARRSEVWGLLGWYHKTVVQPNQGLRGFFRRILLILTGRRLKTLSPWEQIDLRVAMGRMAQEAAARVEEEAGPATDPAPVNPLITHA